MYSVEHVPITMDCLLYTLSESAESMHATDFNQAFIIPAQWVENENEGAFHLYNAGMFTAFNFKQVSDFDHLIVVTY